MTDAEYLRALIAAARDPNLAPDIHDVCGFVDTPEWSVAVREAPPIVRVLSILSTFRGQYYRNGLDGFVWNYRYDVPSLVEAFATIGAPETAALMADILVEIVDRDEEREEADCAARDAVAKFLAVREARSGPAFGPWLPFDPIDEVQEAVFTYLDRHADDVVAGRYPALRP